MPVMICEMKMNNRPEPNSTLDSGANADHAQDATVQAKPSRFRRSLKRSRFVGVSEGGREGDIACELGGADTPNILLNFFRCLLFPGGFPLMSPTTP